MLNRSCAPFGLISTSQSTVPQVKTPDSSVKISDSFLALSSTVWTISGFQPISLTSLIVSSPWPTGRVTATVSNRSLAPVVYAAPALFYFLSALGNQLFSGCSPKPGCFLDVSRLCRFQPRLSVVRQYASCDAKTVSVRRGECPDGYLAASFYDIDKFSLGVSLCSSGR